MKVKNELKRDIEKSIVANKLNAKYFEKVQARELLEHKMSASQREQIKNAITLYKANIAEANIKLDLLEKL